MGPVLWAMGSSSGSWEAVFPTLIQNVFPFMTIPSLGTQSLNEAPSALVTGLVSTMPSLLFRARSWSLPGHISGSGDYLTD